MSRAMTLGEFVGVGDDGDDETASSARERALAGGAKYRGNPAAEHDAERDVDKTECQSCGRPVTPRFRRVFGDRDGIAWACMDSECAGATAIKRGAAASPERDGSVAESIRSGQGGRF